MTLSNIAQRLRPSPFLWMAESTSMHSSTSILLLRNVRGKSAFFREIFLFYFD